MIADERECLHDQTNRVQDVAMHSHSMLAGQLSR